MKIQLHSDERYNAVTGYGDGYIEINRVRHVGALLLPAHGEVQSWHPSGIEALAPEDMESLLALDPELVLLGTGSRHRRIDPALLEPLMRRRIGHEVMGTPAAARTFNILVAEGRRAVAALFPCLPLPPSEACDT